MKIKEKAKYYFHKNLSHEDYPFKELSHNEIETFIKENIVVIRKRFYYNDFAIPTYWHNKKPLINGQYISIQTGKDKCMVLEYDSINKTFYFKYNVKYNIDKLQMMIIYKK